MIIPFQPWHAEAMKVRDVELGPEFGNRALYAIQNGPAVSVIAADERVIASFGMIWIVGRTAEVWALVSRDAPRYAKTLHKAAFWAIGEAHRRHGIRRFQAAIAEDKTTARRWIARLGFAPESALPLFGPKGETFYRYVRFMP